MQKQVTVRGLWLMGLLATLACSSEQRADADEDAPGMSRSALTSAQDRVLGFESLADWSLPSGSTLSSVHVEGASSISVPGGYGELRSVPISSLGATVGDRITVDVRPPSPANNAYWAGDIQAFIDVPSMNINGHSLGQFSLTGLPNGQFSRLSFSLAAGLATSLRGSYSDLRIKLVLNTPPGAGQYLVDRLNVGDGGGAPPLPPAGGIALKLSTPKLVTLTSVTVGSASSVVIGSGATIDRVSVPSTISNVGGGGIRFEPDAVAGDVWSASSVDVRDRVALLGAVRAPSVIRGNDTVITGGTPGTAGLQPIQDFAFSIEFPATSTNLTLDPDVTQSLSPGRLHDVVLKSRSTLMLTAGRYVFDSLVVEPDARLLVDQSAGPVVVYTQSTLQFHGKTEATSGGPPDLLLLHAGVSETIIDHPFQGFLVTPRAKLILRPHQTVNGAIWGQEVEVGAGAAVHHRPLLPILPELGLEPTDCALAVQPPDGLTGRERDIAYQLAIMRYCSKDGLTPCLAELTTRDRLDSVNVVEQVVNGLRTPGSHIAFLRSRVALLKSVRGNEAAACDLLSHDADGDFVVDSADACANTPSLAVVDVSGCTSTSPMPGPTLAEVIPHIKKMGFTADANCWHAPSPPMPSPLGAWRLPADPSQGKAIWISKEPQDTQCPYWVQAQVELVVPGGLRPIWVSFQNFNSSELSWINRPAQALQFNIKTTSTSSNLAAWASYQVYTNRYRVRSINGAGRRSAWSQWFTPSNEPCLNGYCGDINPLTP